MSANARSGHLWGGNFALIAGVTCKRKQTLVLAVAIVLGFIGVFAFFAVALRLV
jgi:putative membrane protein